MPTECSRERYGFARVEGRRVEAAFDGGAVTSAGGAPLLGAGERAIGLVERFAGCFQEARRAGSIEHRVAMLVGQRGFGIALGYEAGAKEEVARIVARIRTHWPEVEIVLRADSGFAREDLMAWCEAGRVDYVFGLARNRRLVGEIEAELERARRDCRESGAPARHFKDFRYQTRKSWSRARRVVGKAEVLSKGDNPRFTVTSLNSGEVAARTLYEELYCARGEMENRIKECQLDLLADRTSAATLRANQLRLWFAAMAYVLPCALRRIGLAHTQFAAATCATIRLKLLKIGAQVRISVRRIKLAMASAYPWQPEGARVDGPFPRLALRRIS